MTSFKVLMQDAIHRVAQAEAEAIKITDALSIPLEVQEVAQTSTPHFDIAIKSFDPLDRERLVAERLSELSNGLGVRYRQVCKDLRDWTRLAWTSDAHELRDLLSTVLRTLAPTEEVKAQAWYKQVKGTELPTQAQRARYILSQSRSQDSAKDSAKESADEFDLIDELISKIVRSTYQGGSQLAHTEATHDDCVRLLFHFDALMFSLLNAAPDASQSQES